LKSGIFSGLIVFGVHVAMRQAFYKNILFNKKQNGSNMSLKMDLVKCLSGPRWHNWDYRQVGYKSDV